MAELALGLIGVVGTIDVCIKWGKAIVAACKAFRDADALLDEMLVRIELCWSRIANQLDVTLELEKHMSLNDRDLQERILSILRGKLEVALHKFTKLAARPVLSVVSKLKFVMCRDAMAETVSELETWQRLYEPSWFHLIKLAPPKIEVTLKQIVKNAGKTDSARSHKVARKFREAFHAPSEIQLQDQDQDGVQDGVQDEVQEQTSTPPTFFINPRLLDGCQTMEIPYCSAILAKRPRSDKYFIIDPTTTGAVLESDAVEFARRFENADPFVFGLLSCKGIVRRHGKTKAMCFLFNIPTEDTVVWGLRQLLLGTTQHDSLTGRLEVARSLVTAVYYIHLYGFVHKNIRPETILSLARPGDAGLPSQAFLVGFQVIRNADGATYPVAELSSWEANLYRHPSRQGTDVDFYVMQHDMYSLGVCLLEIGLWSSFLTYGPHWAAQPSPALGLSRDRAELGDPYVLKDHLVELSRSSALRSRMGTKYSEVVETCLTCLDDENGFGDREEIQKGEVARVDTRYIEKVLVIMNSFSI